MLRVMSLKTPRQSHCSFYVFCLTLSILLFISCGGGGSGSSSPPINPASAKDITAFSFLSAHNPGLSANATGNISGTNITVTLPYAVSPTALIANFTTTGKSVSVSNVAQTSGVTSNNFTTSVTYKVVAEDDSEKEYVVTVTNAANDAKDITAFSFTDAANSALTQDVTGTIDGTNIYVSIPTGTNRTALVATFSTTGQSVRVGSPVQVSGTTANNFTGS